jgi:hypothetical protein
MKEQKPWRRFTLFCIVFGYILAYGARLTFWRSGLGFEDLFVLVIGAWIVWLLISDVSKLAPEETPRRGGWRRRYHHKAEQPPTEHEQHSGSRTVDPPAA